MTDTTTKSMDILLEKSDSRISIKAPTSLTEETNKAAKKLKMNRSRYIKVAISEKNNSVLNK